MFKSNTIIFLVLMLLTFMSSLANLKKSFMKKTRATCSQGFGFDGKCGTSSDLLFSLPYPGTVESLLRKLVLPTLESATSNLKLCVGDFTGSSVTSASGDLSTYDCNNLALSSSSKFGVLAAYVTDLSCSQTQTLKVCAAFDDCGSFIVTMNGGVPQCGASYGTQVGLPVIVSSVANTINSISLGFSQERKFEDTFKVTYFSSDSVTTKQVTTKGQFFVGLNLSLHLTNIKINDVALGNYISIEADGQYMMDYGSGSTFVSSLMASIEVATSADVETIKNSFVEQGAEITGYVKGTLNLKLDDVSNGFLQSLPSTLTSNTKILITPGGSDYNSGLTTGAYIYFNSVDVSNFVDLLDDVYDHFDSVLDLLGFSKPTFSSTNASLGAFISTEAAGFQFDFNSVVIKCVYKLTTSKGSCQFNDKFFTAIADSAGKWAIKKATKFFDESGSTLIEVAQGIGKFATNSALAVSAAKTVVSTVTSTVKSVIKSLTK
jgi:hypothetical protein